MRGIHVLPDARSYYDIGDGISRWDIDTGRCLATVPTGHACWQSWLIAGGTQLVTRASDTNSNAMTIEVWDLQRGTRLLSQGAPTWWVQVAPDGSRVAYEWEGKIVVMDTKTGTTNVSPTAMIPYEVSHTFYEAPVCFQPDGRRLAVCTSLREVALLDPDSFEILSAFEAHKNTITCMVFSADSRWLATGSLDKTIRITNVAANPPTAVATLRGHFGWVRALCFSPDGSLLASCGEDRTVRLWDTRTGSPRGVFESEGFDPSFLPDGQTLINGDTKGVRFWDIRSSEAWILRGHRSFVYPVLVSPDGSTIYSGGWDGSLAQPGSLRFWDAATGDLIAGTGAADVFVRGAALSADGSRLAVSYWGEVSGSRIEVLDTTTGTAVASAYTRRDWPWIESLAFDPSGQNIMWVE